MQVLVVYKKESDHAREVFDYLRDFKIRTGEEIAELDPETREGEGFCMTYGIVEYPTIAAIDDSGRLQQMWRGRPLPQISQVAFYLQSI